MTEQQKSEIVETLSVALEDARQGKITSAILVTMKDNGGGGCWARINSLEDNTAAMGYLKSLRQHLNPRKSA